MKQYLVNVLTNAYFILFVTAALGAALGKIKIKGFTLGSTGGIFSGIILGWIIVQASKGLVKNMAEGDVGFSQLTKLANNELVPSAFTMFFLYLFIAAIGLSVGGKLKTILNRNGLKLVGIGVFIPIVSMGLTVLCLFAAPTLMGDAYNGYEISGLYSGAMTNSAAYGTSLEVVSSMEDINGRYQSLTDEEKGRVMEMIGSGEEADTEAPESAANGELPEALEGGQIQAFLGKAKSNISLGYAVSFPFGTIGMIFAMTLISVILKRGKSPEELAELMGGSHGFQKKQSDRPMVYSAVIFGAVVALGIIIGNINIPLPMGASFSLSAVGGVLIVALVVGCFSKIGPLDLSMNPHALAYMREFALLFFMTMTGLTYGYQVVDAITGPVWVLAVMALFIEAVAIILSILLGRFVMKLNWGLLSGAICGGCTSSVGLGTALNTMGSDEPALGYGAAQPFAILANVLLISVFHSNFFI